MRGKLRCPPTLRRLLKLRKVNPCLTGVGNNPLTITKPSRRAVSRMPKARRSRLSLTRRVGWATLPLCPPSLTYAKILCLALMFSFAYTNTVRFRGHSIYIIPTTRLLFRKSARYCFDITFPYCTIRNRPRHNKNPRRFSSSAADSFTYTLSLIPSLARNDFMHLFRRELWPSVIRIQAVYLLLHVGQSAYSRSPTRPRPAGAPPSGRPAAP